MAAISSPASTILMLEKCKSMPEIRQIHAYMIKTGLVYQTLAISRVVAFCSLSGVSGGLDYATSVFHRIQEPNCFVYFAIIKGFADSRDPLKSLVLYSQLLHCLGEFDGLEFSLPSLLKACGMSKAFEEGLQLHGQILKTRFLFDPFVSNSVVRMYLELGQLGMAKRAFDTLPSRDVFSWNSMIAGYSKANEIDLARGLFDEMPQKDLVSWNTMIDGYARCGRCELARELFDMMPRKDIVSWTAMISGYTFNQRPREAVHLFREMLHVSIRPDSAAVVSVLSAIADLGFIEEGRWVHGYLRAHKCSLSSGFIGSALIDMYAKCGYIEDAYHVFTNISHKRSIGDWNSIISGLALHGLGEDALEIFHEMETIGIEPNEITFLGVLTACCHSGLVEEGELYFKLMKENYKISPKIQHYGCMIDLFSRAGNLKKALTIIHDMPMEADDLAWKAVLSACMKHGDVETGELAAQRVMELAPNDSSCYVLLSNIYAKARRWDDVAKVRSMMRERGVKKIPGCSTVYANGKIHEFLVGMEMDGRYGGMILSKLEEVVCRLKLEGYEPDLTQVLVDVGEEEKESLLKLHGEKMAVSFGLINVGKGALIHIVKNLRVCSDCHSFMKLVSKVYNCNLVVRDQNRFHHFTNGYCSCNDYW
ncbi:pentatricopeptide repeat-containing protein At5g66520-like [Telopea speciosissima]|uniref:pentatricopeptide repeat-containing protein At5g66520-like n=1 Tax=Telopea speciosissima TaxID=54955 RepID=UPI001CC5F614|nr:pentatricopeptide repeat-containing protein At5g66520-like [Telopea speciosissima]